MGRRPQRRRSAPHARTPRQTEWGELAADIITGVKKVCILEEKGDNEDDEDEENQKEQECNTCDGVKIQTARRAKKDRIGIHQRMGLTCGIRVGQITEQDKGWERRYEAEVRSGRVARAHWQKERGCIAGCKCRADSEHVIMGKCKATRDKKDYKIRIRQALGVIAATIPKQKKDLKDMPVWENDRWRMVQS